MSPAPHPPTLSTPLAAQAPRFTLEAIRAQVGGTISGDAGTVITGLNNLESAQPGDLTFAESDAYAPKVRATQASAVIVPPGFPEWAGRALLRVPAPRIAFIKAVSLFQSAAAPAPGVHRKAVIAPDAELGDRVTIRECAVVRSKARVGAGTIIESGAHIGEGASVGAGCFIGPNVVIMRGCRVGDRVILHAGAVIGADGFGFAWHEGRHLKIPQLGNVIIEDDVELGANVCVDRATFGSTIVKRGTKVDNLVQIAHNDLIGEDVIMSGQVGLAGSVTIGDRAVLAGKAGVVDHIVVGADARIGAASAVTKDVPPGQTWWGNPAREIGRTKRELAALGLLPRVLKKLQQAARSRSSSVPPDSQRPPGRRRPSTSAQDAAPSRIEGRRPRPAR